MALNLRPEDLTEYNRRCWQVTKEKLAAERAGDLIALEQSCKKLVRLYREFERRQLPATPSPESLETRVDRIERFLRLGQYSSF